MAPVRSGRGLRRNLAAGPLQPMIDSFDLHLRAERKSPKTIRTYTEAAQWLAGAYLLPAGIESWDQAGRPEVQGWIAALNDRYSDCYANNQFRALQQFFRWYSAEAGRPSPMTGLRPPKIDEKIVPVITDDELAALLATCKGTRFEARRDRAILLPDPRTSCTRWEQVSSHDVQRWLVHLLTRYSDAYASNQFRALQQFFRWLSEEEQLPDPMTRLRAPRVTGKLVPVFSSGELSALAKVCQGRSFAQRRDAAIMAVLTATGIRAGELAGIRYDPHDPRRSDVDLWRREITVRGKGGRVRVVRIGHEAARALDRYIRVRSRHAQAWRPQLWLGVNNRGPMTANGIYQMISRRGRECGVDAWPHRFRHHFSHTWLDRGGAEGDLMELNGWSSPQMLRRYGASARSARARRTYDRIMQGGP